MGDGWEDPSEDTLYRIIPWNYDDRTPRIAVAPQEQLQAVEIDYEEAWGYARQEDNGHIAARKNDDLVTLDKTDVMALIDRALGIGGGDDAKR
jgi:hypothetical protein